MLRLEQVVKRLPDGRQLLGGINLEVRRGEFIGILGASGAGKSLTLRCILALTKLSEGTIRFQPSEDEAFDMGTVRGHRLRAARRQMGVVFQDFNLVERISVLENVLIGRLGWIHPLRSWLYGFTDQEAGEALAALSSVRMSEFADRQTATLSRGEMQRVALARAIFQRPAMLLVDEPISSVDPNNARIILERLSEIAGSAPVLGAFHQPELTARYCTRVVGIRDGVVVYDGSPQLSTASLRDIYGGDHLFEPKRTPALVPATGWPLGESSGA